MQRILIGWLIGLLLCPYGCISSVGQGGQDIPKAPAFPKSVPVQPGTEAEYRIRPGDTLIITLWEHSELSRERSVSPEGCLRLPFLGELKVTDLTISELEKTLTKAMTPYIKNVIITVELKTMLPTKTITILGAVVKPGNYTFSMPEKITVISLLGSVGSYTESANLEEIYLFRTNPETPNQREKFRIDLKSILSDPTDKDIVLQDKDMLIVGQTMQSNLNTNIQEITPSLQLIAIILGIIWGVRQLQNKD